MTRGLPLSCCLRSPFENATALEGYLKEFEVTRRVLSQYRHCAGEFDGDEIWMQVGGSVERHQWPLRRLTTRHVQYRSDDALKRMHATRRGAVAGSAVATTNRPTVNAVAFRRTMVLQGLASLLAVDRCLPNPGFAECCHWHRA